jgi:hypothetical protein
MLFARQHGDPLLFALVPQVDNPIRNKTKTYIAVPLMFGKGYVLDLFRKAPRLKPGFLAREAVYSADAWICEAFENRREYWPYFRGSQELHTFNDQVTNRFPCEKSGLGWLVSCSLVRMSQLPVPGVLHFRPPRSSSQPGKASKMLHHCTTAQVPLRELPRFQLRAVDQKESPASLSAGLAGNSDLCKGRGIRICDTPC